MRPVSNCPAWLYASAKTHKFNNINDVNFDLLWTKWELIHIMLLK